MLLAQKHLLNVGHDFFLSHLIKLGAGSDSSFGLYLLELLKLCFLLIFKLSDLLDDGLEDLVGGHIIELSESRVHSFGVMESDVLGAVASKNALGLATEHNFLNPLNVTVLLACSSIGSLLLLLGSLPSELQFVVHYGLLLVSFTPVVTALHELLDEPLNHRVYFRVVETLNLLRREQHGTVHLLECGDDLLGHLDLLTHVQVVRELDVDVEVASRDGPAHTAQDFVEGVDRVETCSEITTCNQNVIDFLDQLLLSLLLHVRDLARVLSLEHLCLLLCVSYLL